MADTMGGTTSNNAKFFVDLVIRNIDGLQKTIAQSTSQIAHKNKGILNTQGVIMGTALGSGIGTSISIAITKYLRRQNLKSVTSAIGQAMSTQAASGAGGFLPVSALNSLKVKSWRLIHTYSNFILKNVLKIAAVIGTLRILGSFVGKWADFNEELNKTQMLFREATHMATKFSDTMQKAYGISRTNTLKLVGDIQNTLMPFVSGKTLKNAKLNPSGTTSKRTFAGQKAIQIAERVMDIASLRNLDVDEVATLMTSAIIRGGRAAQSLGAAMSAVEVEQRALVMSGKTRIKDLTLEEKQHARIAIILERTSDAHGDMMRTAGSIANAWRGLKGTFSETLMLVGAILDVIDIGGILLNIGAGLRIINQGLKTVAAVAQGIKKIFTLVWDGINVGLNAVSWGLNAAAKALENLGSKARKVIDSLGGAWAGGKFQENYKTMVAEIDRLKRLQTNDPEKDYSSRIAFYESIARANANLAALMGQAIDVKDPFDDVNDSLETMEKLTSSIHNNLLKIGEDMQEAVMKINLDELGKVDFNKYINVPSQSNLSGYNAGFSMNELLKALGIQTDTLMEMLLEMKKGIYA